MSQTNLEWCPGCQANVQPKMTFPGRECPRCGTSLKRTPIEPDIDPQFDFEDGLDIEFEREPRSFSSDLISTPRSGRLVLNPKVDRESKNPLCPVCEDPIKRFESPNEVVEFRCGCSDLRYFDFEEIDPDVNKEDSQ